MGCRQRDFMFCEMCGTMLSFNSPIKVTCPVCNHQKRIKDFGHAEIRYTLTAEDLRRELGVSALDVIEEEKELKQIDPNAKCKACQHMGLTYTTKQTRSADEGQTIFYSCPKCGSKETLNS